LLIPEPLGSFFIRYAQRINGADINVLSSIIYSYEFTIPLPIVIVRGTIDEVVRNIRQDCLEILFADIDINVVHLTRGTIEFCRKATCDLVLDVMSVQNTDDPPESISYCFGNIHIRLALVARVRSQANWQTSL